MKNLRQLIRRYTNSDHAAGRPKRSRRGGASTQRRLSTESLERRELLAAGIVNQNSWSQYDVNNDYTVTARDALGVINFLARDGEAQEGADDGSLMFYDVNGDNVVTAADALGVINAIGRGEGETGDLVEWLLTARQTGVDPGGFGDNFNLDLIQADVNGDINVEVGEVFDVEFSFDDLRSGGSRLGMFQAITNITSSLPNVLTLVMFETQQFFIGSEIDEYNSGQLNEGTITVSVPELPPGAAPGTPLSASMDLGTFSSSGNFFLGQLVEQLGFDRDHFIVERPQNAGSDGQAYQISFGDSAHRNVDLPDIAITLSGNPSGTILNDDDPPQPIPAPPFNTVPITPVSIAPQIDQGGQMVFNPLAVPLNVNTFSRTFDDNDQFYDSNVAGSFDPAVGFTGLKGIGGVPTGGGGIPDLASNGVYFPGPFDFLSFSVYVNQEVTDLVLSVIPTPGEAEAALLYGVDDPIGEDPSTTGTVILEDVNDTDVMGNGKAVLVINATDPNATDPPVAASGLMPAFDEGSTGALNLSGLLSAGVPDTVTASSANLPGTVNVGSGPNFSLTYTPVDDDENTNGTITYTATNAGGTDSGTISVTINPINDAPVAVNDPGPFQVVAGSTLTLTHAQLTANDDPGASDEGSDPLTAIPEGITSANAGTIAAVGTGIQYTPPGGGFTGNDSFTYRVNDGTVNSGNTATVTVNVTSVAVDPPTAADGPVPAFNEGSNGNLNLSSLLGGGVPTSVTVSDQGSLGTATIGPGPNFTLTYTPSDVNNFGPDSIEYTASNAGGSETGTISITINPVNDPPVADNETLSTPENTPLQIPFATLLNGDTVGPANEIPLDTLSITIVNDPLNPLASLDQNGNLTYNPPPDFFGSDSFTYEITDGSPDGPLTATGTVTINITEGPNNVPEVDGPLGESFSEDDGPTTITQADMLFGASDEDDDTLIVRNLVRTSGAAAGITIVGNALSVTPGANGSLTEGSSANAVFSYEIFDGQAAVDQSITITVNGENDPPSAGNVDDVTTFTGSDPVIIDVLAEADAGSGENQTLSILSASLSNPAAGSVTFNSTIVFTPAPGFEGDTTINYEISDGTASDTGSVQASVLDFDPSLIGGYIFIDRIENIRDVMTGATPFRDGMKDSNEQGLGGITVKLVSDEMTWTAVTDLDGGYEFMNVAPGSYTLMYDPIPNVIHGPVVPMSIEIGLAGGVTDDQRNVPLLGLIPESTSAIDLLARTYLNSSLTVSLLSNGGSEGAFVSLDATGASNFIMAGEGFDDVKYADIRKIAGSNTDVALLTVLQENGDVSSALIPTENAIFGPDGLTMRLFGGIDDLPFQTYDQNVSTVEGFQAAIDDILADME